MKKPAHHGNASEIDATPPSPLGAFRIGAAKLSTALLATVALAIIGSDASAASLTVNFAERSDPPLLKKMALYNAGVLGLDKYEQLLPHIDPLKAESLRIDVSIGKGSMWTDEIVSGTADNLEFNFDEIDRYSRMLNARNVLPYQSWCYNPYPLQDPDSEEEPYPGGRWKTAPKDLNKWSEVLETLAKHFREQDIRVGYHEIWNEPDLIFFSLFDWETFLQVYKYGALGVQRGDPDGLVGGPAVAVYHPHDIVRFLEFVREEELPLDFFSYHAYGEDFMSPYWQVRNKLDSHGFDTTEIHINEFNMLPIPRHQESRLHPMASAALDAAYRSIAETSLTMVHWAQFMESGFGLLNNEGKRRPAYYALSMYAAMPVERVVAEGSDSLRTLASTDGRRASAIVWNSSDEEQTFRMSLQNIPFAQGDLRIYRIDENHPGESARLDPILHVPGRETEAFQWSGSIPARGVVYFLFDDPSAAPEPEPIQARVIRKRHFYPDRSKDNYASFNETTWTAHLGMGSHDEAYSLAAVEATDFPQSFTVSFDIDGNLRTLDQNSLLGLRVDYKTGDDYQKAVLFHNGVYDTDRDAGMPWGTGKQVDRAMRVDNLSAWTLELGKHAPDGWEGRAIISFMMQNTGTGTRASVALQNGGSPDMTTIKTNTGQ